MAKCIMRVNKVKGNSSIKGAQRHNQAKEEYVKAMIKDDMETMGHTNIRIENLSLNKHLKECDDFYNTIQTEIKAHIGDKKVRKDAVTLLEQVYTYSPEKTPNLMCYLHREDQEWIKDNQELFNAYKSLSKEERKEIVNKEYKWVMDYFKACVEYTNAHYGICISAEVHFHETTPHLHANSIPLVKDEKKGEWKLCAKDILGNKAQMSKNQTRFYEEVGKEHGLERGDIRNTKEIKKHISKEQHEYEKIKEQKLNLQQQFDLLKEDYEELNGKYENLQNVMSNMIGILDKLEIINARIGSVLDQMDYDTRDTVRTLQRTISKEQKDLSKFIKEKNTELVFGSIDKLEKEVNELENTVDEFER